MMVYVIICVFIPSTLAAQINVEPVYLEVFQGDNFTVNVTVYPQGSEVYSASYTLYFNNTLLNAISQTQGEFLRQDDQSSSVWTDEIDNTIGKIEYAESRSGTDVGVTESGVLAAIIFQVIGEEGDSPLNISDYEGEILYSNSPPGPVLADINNGTCKIGEIIGQTPTPTPTTTTPMQTQTTIPITPTPAATAIQTPTIPSTPLSSPNIIKSPTASMPPSEEKSNDKNGLPGFKATFAVTGLLIVLILKLKNVRK